MTTNPTKSAVHAWALLVRKSQHVLNSVERDLKAAGLPPLSWYDALLELERAETGQLRPFELEQRMLLAQYHMSRLTARLAKAGYVERLACAEDGRGQIIRITGAGRTLLTRMWPVYAGAIRRHFADKMTDEEAAVLARMLGKL
jgi:DNA-binding MarR family transcriptional regulator